MKYIKVIIIVTLSIIFTIENIYSQSKFNINLVKETTKLEFHKFPMIKECKDPHKIKIRFISREKAVVFSWYKGCPNSRVSEEELEYKVIIDNAEDYRFEYDWITSDNKVVLLVNDEAGYLNGYSHLEKRYIITNTYNGSTFLGANIYHQLDVQEYPSRRGVYVSAGNLVKIN
jgi:hypothetical protein